MEDPRNNDEGEFFSLKIPSSDENLREELNFYKELKVLFKEYNKPVEGIDFIIKNIESNIHIFTHVNISILDEEKIIKQIEKHPYFKNPGDYPIRLLTILKYLKKKGFNMHYKDIDIYIDSIVQKLDGVKKIERGLYIKNR